ncbi:MAG: hypothetical protein LBM67_08310 [Lentimicrobiaceae bacterium]|jgi:hypothetical protein|nr:hypothetical protein [Lentimicrobiaceae bacterium]
MKKINVLVACEYSGCVRDAFENYGKQIGVEVNAWSCDILPTESEQTKAAGKHIQGDVLHLLADYFGEELPFYYFRGDYDLPEKWDILIGHPPCTYLSFAYTGKKRYDIDRLYKKLEAYKFFLDLWAAPIEHICLENPMGYIHTGLLPYTQIIEPYFWGKDFGEDYKKRTCLWLKNLPKLTHSKENNLFEVGKEVEAKRIFLDNMTKKKRKGNRLVERQSYLKPFASKSERSRFHKGIAAAMAKQWIDYLLKL